MKLFLIALTGLCSIETAFGLLSLSSRSALCTQDDIFNHPNRHLKFRASHCLQATAEGGDETSPPPDDLTGKTIYQRTFYRLTPGSQVSIPNALVLEERLRFQVDPEKPGYIQPIQGRSYIFRKGTDQDEITSPLYRFDIGGVDDGGKPHNGPGTMDESIATALWMASNPHLIQGDMLQLGCGSGAASILGCIGAKLVLGEALADNTGEDWSAKLLTVPEKHKSVFPEKLSHLTLTDESQEAVNEALDIAKSFDSKQITLKDLRWSTRVPAGRRFDRAYRTILGSDLDFSYPSSKELARTVANHLLPSNDLALASIKEGVAGGSASFGGLGMDIGDSSSSAPTTTTTDKATLDQKIPPTFVHIAPETNENLRYLKQFLEKGFKMNVDSGYVNLERLTFTFQTLDQGTDEAELEDLDTLELKDDFTKGFQFVQAFHHPDYSGQGTGEYFFPLETGEYEGGSKSTWLEPEEGGSPW